MLFTVAALFCSCLSVQNVWAKESVWSVGRTLLLLLLLPLLLLAKKKSLTHARVRACARTHSHTHTLSARARRRKAGFLRREKKTLTAGEVWRPSIVRRSRAGSAGKLGPIHRCTRARTEARVCSRGFILRLPSPPLPSHPCAIPPSILNPLLCTSVRGAHSGRSIQPRARKKNHSIETHTHTHTPAKASCDTFIPHIFITTARDLYANKQVVVMVVGGGAKKRRDLLCDNSCKAKRRGGG